MENKEDKNCPFKIYGGNEMEKKEETKRLMPVVKKIEQRADGELVDPETGRCPCCWPN